MTLALPVTAQEAKPVRRVLYTNVNVIDGMNEALIENANVVVTVSLITAVSTEPLAIAGGDEVTSTCDPLDDTQYTYEEMKPIVGVAENWNTYVAAPMFTDEAIQIAIKAGPRRRYLDMDRLYLPQESGKASARVA